MSVEIFDELFRLVESYISKTDTVMKAAIPARLNDSLPVGIPFHHLPYYLEFHHAPFPEFYPKHCNQLSTHWV